MYPFLKKEKSFKVSSDHSGNTSRYRWKKDWHDSLEKEDEFLLFGNPYMKRSHLNKEESRFSNLSPSVQELLCRYVNINQERYFWDFLECYEKEEDTYNYESFKNDSACLPSDYTEHFEKEENKHFIASPPTLYEHTKKEDIHLNDPTSCAAVHSNTTNLQKKNKKKNINLRDIAYLKQEISEKTKRPVLAELLKQWCEASNKTIPTVPSAGKKLLDFVQLYQQDGGSMETKSFHELYPTPTPDQIKELEKLNTLSIKSKYKIKENEENIIVTQEKRSVGGGRYFIR